MIIKKLGHTIEFTQDGKIPGTKGQCVAYYFPWMRIDNKPWRSHPDHVCRKQLELIELIQSIDVQADLEAVIDWIESGDNWQDIG